MLKHLSDYDAVFIHYLTASARLVVDKAPDSTRFVWLGWGGDYYHLICAPQELLMPVTKQLMARMPPSGAPTGRLDKICRFIGDAKKGLSKPLWTLRRLASLLRLRHIGCNRPSEGDLLERFELFAPVLIEDYKAIGRRTPTFHPRFVRWNYPSLPMPQQSSMHRVDGYNILIGNSATPENNHLDAFDMIRDSIGAEREIICPLSYGVRAYGDAIESIGYEMFRSKFRPLRQFMEADSYTSTLRTCSVVAMNHIRQQALGNILMMLWFGARVFLNHRSPIVVELKNLGIHVFDIQTLPDFLRAPNQPVSDNQLKDIRERLTLRYGHNALLKLTAELLNTCTKDASFRSLQSHEVGASVMSSRP